MRTALFATTIISTALFCTNAIAQAGVLSDRIDKILEGKNTVTGVAVCTIGSTDTVSVNGSAHLPMQSVFKFHVALAVLDRVDAGVLALDQKIHLTKADLLPDTWSPIRDKYPNAEVSLTIGQLIEYTVAQSDNNGCDILLRLIGGTQATEGYLHRIGSTDVEIKASEEQMHAQWDVQYQNWTTPKSAVWLLSQFCAGKTLSAHSRDFLYGIMESTATGTKRLKGLLPTGTVVAHKTGSSDTNSAGITAATNDIGIVTLPDGSAYAIAVFVSDSSEDNTTNEAIIAEISQAAWQYYNEKL